MHKAVYLPAYEASGENETTLTSSNFNHCKVDSDCNLSFICLPTNVSWFNDSGVAFYQHDGVRGSNNYIQFTQRPKYNVCSCPTTGGWTGYDCTDFDSSHAFDLFLFISTAVLLFGIITVGTYDIIAQIRFKGWEASQSRTVVALVFNILGAIFLFMARIVQIVMASQPKNFIIRANGRKSSASTFFLITWFDNLAGIFSAMAVFQIAYCWIEVSNNVRKLKKLSNSREIDMLQRAILFFQVSLAITSFILLISGQIEYLFVMVLPWTVVVLYLTTIGAWRMIRILKQALNTVATASVMQPTSKENEYQNIVNSIQYSSRLISFFIFLTFVCSMAMFYIFISDRNSLAYPPGLWHRPIIWWSHGLFSIGMVGGMVAVFHYLHFWLSAKKSKSNKSDNTVSDLQRQGMKSTNAVKVSEMAAMSTISGGKQISVAPE